MYIENTDIPPTTPILRRLTVKKIIAIGIFVMVLLIIFCIKISYHQESTLAIQVAELKKELAETKTAQAASTATNLPKLLRDTKPTSLMQLQDSPARTNTALPAEVAEVAVAPLPPIQYSPAELEAQRVELKKQVVELQIAVRYQKNNLEKLKAQAKVRDTGSLARLTWKGAIENKEDQIRALTDNLAETQAKLNALTQPSN
jgi:ribosomal protein L29